MNPTARRALASLALACIAAAAVACASHLRTGPPAALDQASVNASATFPPGAQGDLIRYGRDIIAQTPKYAGIYVSARMSCQACHPNAGTKAHAGSLLGSYARFPQWNKRAHRFIALQDRIAECFLYSMNGKPPAYYSREMIAITAYIAWLSRGAPTGTGFPNQDPVTVRAAKPPNAPRGARIYAARCTACHGVDGNGAGTDPPLWGAASFNDKAGMSRMDRLVPFIRAAMPLDAPGSLTDQEATDVAAFILSRPRPHFDRAKLVGFPPERAGYF